MFKKKALLRAIVATSLTSALVACGGGSSSGSTPPVNQTPPTENTGNFIDSPVGGLQYEAKPSGITGVTGDDGRFRFMDGDAVYFKVGNYFVGSADGAKMISPKSIGLTNEDAVANIARFLQTLDDDGILENGITINNAARETARNSTGGEVSALDLSSESAKAGILELTEKNSVQRAELVDRASALGHLNQTLADFEAASKVSCSSDDAAVENDDLTGKFFGRIGNGEITLFEFSSTTEFKEIANDEGKQIERSGSWSIDGQAKTLTLTFEGGSDTVGVCGTGQGIILDDGETPMIFWETAPFTSSQDETFQIATGTDQGTLLQLNSETKAYSMLNGTGTSEQGTYYVEGETNPFFYLSPDDNSGFSEAFFLKGQDNRIAIYLQYTTEGDVNNLTAVGTATATPNLTDVGPDTFAGNSFLLRNEGENSVYMLDFTNSSFVRYTNETDTGEQGAVFSKGTWSLAGNALTLDADGGASETFRAWDAGNLLFVADEGSDILARLYKTQPVTLGTFTGEYNVNIPTENVVNNKLVINDNKTCSYDGTACEWAINTKGHAVVSFPGKPEQGHIWQVAGRSSAFGFVMKHEDANDIEPGFMTRQ
ncbi:hypothetical protein FDP08_09440 [Marinobacter panjinensis]|uniref:Uncharacterized protein n=1 Tax=Marinobacter panjinensis TaxID=2576384 RepID=A0A4U6R3T2_9GAMM|nr:hypothetical protein [Marinobacter panjinensis]MCR8916234.1 hypothetical protein [Marinobacter panjinensis]TKV68300.1 hypothetical protein FDP08_09440 [Marinobacter panjinensis]